VPVAEIDAGTLFWPIERAPDILKAWRAWIDTAPETCESLGRMLQLPDVPFLPRRSRGRSFVLLEAAIIGTETEAAALVQPLRDLAPIMDTMATMPTSELSAVNMDPDFPLPYAGDDALLDDPPVSAFHGLVEAFVVALSRVDPRSIFPPEGNQRLLQVNARYDPTDRFRANHPVARR